MDLKSIRWDVQSRIKALYAQRFPVPKQPPVDIPGFDEQIARWKRFLKHTNTFEGHYLRVRKNQDRRARLKQRARKIVADPKPFKLVAIDIIPDPDETRITQVGVAVQTHRDGTMAIQLDIEGAGGEYVGDRRGVTLQDAMDHVRAELEHADYVVGHSLHNDFQRADDWGGGIPKRGVLDTGHFHRFLKGSYTDPESPKLSELMALYGVPAADMTVAGNHAKAALDVMNIMMRMV